MLDTSLKASVPHFDQLLQNLITDTQEELSKVMARIDELSILLQDKDMLTDRSENASYQIAKDERDVKVTIQSLLQKRLAALHKEADSSAYKPLGVVQLGSIIELSLLSISGKKPVDPRTNFVLKVVSHDLAKAKTGLIAIDSKVGAAIQQKRAGEVFEVSATKGIVKYKIERVY